MPRAKTVVEYSKLSIPRDLFEELDRLVAEVPERGYRSASDAATDAIRRFVEVLKAEGGSRRPKR